MFPFPFLTFDVPCRDCGGPSSECGGNCGKVDDDAK